MKLHGVGRCLGWTRPFGDPEVEQRFQEEQQALDRCQDRRIGILVVVLVLGACIRFHRHMDASTQLLGLAVGVLHLAPWVWCSVLGAADSYSRHRLWVVAGLRLLSVFTPQMASMKQVKAPLSVPSTPASWLACLVFMLKLPRLLITSLGFRLPCCLHFIVHTTVLAIQLRGLPDLCLMPLFATAASRSLFDRAAQLLAWAGAVVSFVGDGPQHGAARHGAAQQGADEPAGAAAACGTLLLLMPRRGPHCHCVLVLGTLMVLLGYAVPALVLARWEHSARAAFLAAQPRQRWLPGDLQEYLIPDWIPAAVALLAVQPLLLSLVWHVAALTAVKAGVC